MYYITHVKIKITTKTVVEAHEDLNSSIKARCNSAIKIKPEHYYFPLKS